MYNIQNNLNTQTRKITVNFSIDKTLYEQFKFKTVNSSMNLQKLVNRSVHRYLNDVIVKEQIENYDKLYASGSRF